MEHKRDKIEVVVNPIMRNMIPYIVIAVVAALTFASSLRLPFLSDWDDPIHIVNNSRLAFSISNFAYWFTHDIVAVYMPFTMLSYMVDHAIWGLNPVGYRITTLLLHIVAAWGVYKCFRYFRIGTTVAILFSLIFAVHPQRVESVVWMSERKDVLCAAFYFWSVYWYLREIDGSWKRWFPAFVLGICALLSKPMAVSLPFVLLCIEFNHRRCSDAWYSYKRVIPFLIAALGLMGVTYYFQVTALRLKPDYFHQAGVVLHNIYWYVVQTIIPVELVPIYPRVEIGVPLFVRCGIFLATVSIVLLYLYNKLGGMKFVYSILPLVFSYLFALAPVAGFIQVGYTDYADRYSYIPSAFLWFMAALACRNFCRGGETAVRIWRVAGWLVAMLYLSLSIYYDQIQFPDWTSLHALVKRSVTLESCNEVALYKYGLLCYNNKDYSETVKVIQRLEDFDKKRLSPGKHAEIRSMYLYLAGKIYLLTGNHSRAYANFREVKNIFKKNRMRSIGEMQGVIEDLYNIEFRRGDPGRLIELIDIYLEICDAYHVRTRMFYYYSGMKAVFSDDYKVAAENFKKILEKNPDDKVAEANYRRAVQMLESKRKLKTVDEKSEK